MSSDDKNNTLSKRRNAYAYGLLGCILALAGIGLMGIWGLIGFQEASITFKLVVTLIVLACLSGFLYTLSFQQEQKNKKILICISGTMGVLLSASIILQVWVSLFNNEVFGQLLMTFIVIGVISAFVIALFDDFFENKKLKDDNYLD